MLRLHVSWAHQIHQASWGHPSYQATGRNANGVFVGPEDKPCARSHKANTGSQRDLHRNSNGIKESCIQIPSESHAYHAWSSKNRSQTNHPLRCAALLGKGHHVVAVKVQRLRSTKEHGFSCCPRSLENAEDLRGLECRLYWDRYANIIPKYPKCLKGDARVPTAFDSYTCCGLTIRS